MLYLYRTVSGTEGLENKSINRTRREVPPTAKNFKLQLFSTHVYKHKDTTLIGDNKEKPIKKYMNSLSSLHPSVNIAENEKSPEAIQYFNTTKFGVDIMDQMARKYSVKSLPRYWPVNVFFNVLNLACINSWILYKDVTGRNIRRGNSSWNCAKNCEQCTWLT
ncbi:hypothetical protein PR048_023469 [Dryococelus australis]|uniref:PiggyBac transposable element-derived protein domain-containing protein n=1 Tax=Dryococelus australis TaxID=614101 RepID=A0ABQ9GU94_9NEOP|nr:hypothetical protein PR048_023469 [Dryococelus australis]